MVGDGDIRIDLGYTLRKWRMVETGSGSAQMAGFGINFIEPSGSAVVHGLQIVVCRPVKSIFELHTVCPWHLGTKASVSESLMCYRLRL